MEPWKQHSIPNPRLLEPIPLAANVLTQHPSYMKSPWRSLGGAEPLWQLKWKIQKLPLKSKQNWLQIKEGATAQVHYKDNKHLLYPPWRRGMQRKWPYQFRRVPRFYKHSPFLSLPFIEHLLCASNEANFTNIIIAILQTAQVNGSLAMSFRWIRFLTLSYETGQGITSIWHVKKVSLESLYENCTRYWESQNLKVKPRLQIYRNAKPCLMTIKSCFLSLFWSLQYTSKVSATILTLQMRTLRLREFKSLSEDIELVSRKAGVQIQDHLTPKLKLFIMILHHLSFRWAVSSFIQGLCIKT